MNQIWLKKLWRKIQFFVQLPGEIRKLIGAKLRLQLLKDAGLVVMDKHTYGLPNIYFWDQNTKLTIGKFCSIAEGVTFILGGEHRLDWVSTYPFSEFTQNWSHATGVTGHPATKGDINIGHDVWIGHGAMILSGVTIGNGAVVGAGSVVAKNIPPYAVVAGNPATVIKFRFNEKDIAHLQNYNWWELSDSEINNIVVSLMEKPNFSELN